MIELIPCPFCGGKAEWNKKNKAPQCSQCKATIPSAGVYFKNILIRIIDIANIWLGFGIGGLTMAKYIELERALALIRPDAPEDEKVAITITTAKKLLRNLLDRAPAADAARVMHGKWISLTDCSNAGVYCSICHKKVYKEDYAWCNKKNKVRSSYCPNCGAKMDGGING